MRITLQRRRRATRGADRWKLKLCVLIALHDVCDPRSSLGETRAKAPPSKRVLADNFPVVALAEFVAFVVADPAGGTLQEFLDVAAGGGRGVEKQDAAGFAAGVLPSMRDVAREKRAGARPADGNLVADLKGDLAGEHPGDLVAVAV